MANSNDDIVVDFGSVSAWLFPNHPGKLLAQKIAAAVFTPGDDITTQHEENGKTDLLDPFDLES